MNVQLPPPLAFENLEGEDRERAERVISQVVRLVTEMAADVGPDNVDDMTAALKALRAEVTERDGEIGREAFDDCLGLLDWMLGRHKKSSVPDSEA